MYAFRIKLRKCIFEFLLAKVCSCEKRKAKEVEIIALATNNKIKKNTLPVFFFNCDVYYPTHKCIAISLYYYISTQIATASQIQIHSNAFFESSQSFEASSLLLLSFFLSFTHSLTLGVSDIQGKEKLFLSFSYSISVTVNICPSHRIFYFSFQPATAPTFLSSVSCLN